MSQENVAGSDLGWSTGPDVSSSELSDSCQSPQPQGASLWQSVCFGLFCACYLYDVICCACGFVVDWVCVLMAPLPPPRQPLSL